MQAIEPALDVVGADEMSLVRVARKGDVGAFEELIRRNDRRVFRIARSIVQNQEEAEEIVQDVFLKAFEHLDQFQQKSRFSTWLYRIAVNTALMRLRKLRRGDVVSIDQYDQSEPGAMPHEIVDWRPNPEGLYGRPELREILARNLDALPAHYRTVFLLRDVEGLSTD